MTELGVMEMLGSATEETVTIVAGDTAAGVMDRSWSTALAIWLNSPPTAAVASASNDDAGASTVSVQEGSDPPRGCLIK